MFALIKKLLAPAVTTNNLKSKAIHLVRLDRQNHKFFGCNFYK